MKHLEGLTQLEILWIGGPGITDKGMSYVANMKKMGNLNITGDFSNKGLRYLEGLKYMQRLRVTSQDAFSNAAIKRLHRRLPNIHIFKVMP